MLLVGLSAQKFTTLLYYLEFSFCVAYDLILVPAEVLVCVRLVYFR